MMNTRGRRKALDVMMTGACGAAIALTVLPLFSIFVYLVIKGVGSLNLDFLTQLPKPVGEPGGGMANAIVGSGIVIGIAALIGLPVGILAGIYLSEYGRSSIFGYAVRFFANVIQGVPSIVIGIVAYTIVVLPMGRFSAYAGGVALAIMLIPFITRTSEEACLMVPEDMRAAGIALGAPKWRVTIDLVLRSARGPVMTGVILGIARIAGETAPLLFTALNNRFWHQGLGGPIATLTVQIYTYAISPFADWNRQAWAGALVLIFLMLILSILARFFSRSKYSQRM